MHSSATIFPWPLSVVPNHVFITSNQIWVLYHTPHLHNLKFLLKRGEPQCAGVSLDDNAPQGQVYF